VIYSLVGALVAGTKYRGLLKASCADESARKNRIHLFIDEIHTIIGAGSASWGMDASNLIKPVLPASCAVLVPRLSGVSRGFEKIMPWRVDSRKSILEPSVEDTI
jgi:ATP-dependent Clp protease ATP-binding subunit ClpA